MNGEAPRAVSPPGGADPAGRHLSVALLNPVFWPEVRRGSERLVRDLADGLRGRGHAVALITAHRGLPSRREEGGLEVIRNWRPPDGRLRRRLFEDHLTHVPFSYLSLRRSGADVAQALYPTDALAAARWGERTGRPSILSYMGIPHRRSLADRRWRIGILRRAIEGCSAVTSLSEAADRGFQRWLGVSTRVIPPGVDLAAFSPGPGRDPTPTIFFPGSLEDPRKRSQLLLAAFSLLRRSRPDARLILSGPTDERSVGAEGIERLNVDAREDMAAAYRRAWVTVLPSLHEAFGLVLAESLACGTPVVGTRSGAIPELVDRPEVGVLFKGSEPEPLTRAILEALDLAVDPTTAAACRARAEHFSLERFVSAHEDLYAELVAEHPGRGASPARDREKNRA